MLSLVRPQLGKITEDMKVLIEETLRSKDEVTSTGLKSLLPARWPELRRSVDFHYQMCTMKDGLSHTLQ